jgi:DHA2 family multidrug resistance protein
MPDTLERLERRPPPSAPPPAPAAPPAAPTDGISFRNWIAVSGGVLGAFMAVLNIQITNASLPDIQGGIGAGIDDGGWVSTSYLIGEIITIPLSGWLSDVFSVRRYLLVNAALFLVFSGLCGLSENLGEMIVLRAIQGFTGGVLIPMAFTLIMTLMPPAKRPVGLAMFAISAIFAPSIGPTIGGYFTETYGWQAIFYINLVPGGLMVAMLWWSLEAKPMKLHRLKEGDWFGIASIAIGLGAFQTVLEEGNRDDWFGSPFILRLSVVASIAFAVFLWVELTVKKPLVNLRLFARRNFGLGTAANFFFGFSLYGSVFLMPLYLSQSQGYNSEQVGEVLAWTGLPQLVLIPFVPMLMKRIDARVLVFTGLVLFAYSNFADMWLSPDIGGDQLFWPNIVRALGQALAMTPLSAFGTDGIERENTGSASSLFNMMRNLGGACGIATLETFTSRREQYHSSILLAHVSPFEEATRQRLALLQHYFMAHGVTDPALALHEAVIAVGQAVRAQAYFFAYGDGFAMIGGIVVTAACISMGLRRLSVGGGGGGGH